MITTNIVHLCLLNQRPDLWLLQVLDVVKIGGGEISAERAVLAGDDNTASTGGLLVIDTVLDTDALLLGLGA